MFHMSSSSDSTDSSVLLQFSACATCWFLRTAGKGFSYAVHSLRRWSWLACSFCGTQTVRFLEFPIPLSYCFVWYLARKPRCTMFPHYCLLVVKWVTKPWHKTQEENLIIYSFLWHALVPCGRVCLWATDLQNPGGNYNSLRDFGNTLYFVVNLFQRPQGREQCQKNAI
jgi:hypothetical protein